jgi:hypothetical protein
MNSVPEISKLENAARDIVRNGKREKKLRFFFLSTPIMAATY